jgi:hypothetical protein
MGATFEVSDPELDAPDGTIAYLEDYGGIYERHNSYWAKAEYTLDDQPIDIPELIKINEFDEGEVHLLTLLKAGGSLMFGGGAAASFKLTRVL